MSCVGSADRPALTTRRAVHVTNARAALKVLVALRRLDREHARALLLAPRDLGVVRRLARALSLTLGAELLASCRLLLLPRAVVLGEPPRSRVEVRVEHLDAGRRTRSARLAASRHVAPTADATAIVPRGGA